VSGVRVGVMGATGLVGTEMLRLLEERAFPVAELRAFASSRSEGRRVPFAGGEVVCEVLRDGCFDGLDLVIVDVDEPIAQEWAPRAAAAGARVIDKSSAFRMDPDVPLVVAEVNPDDLRELPKGIASCPNCTTMVLVAAIAPLHRAARIERMVVSTYQAASGAGQAGMHFSAAEWVHVELIDPETGAAKKLSDGETGELVYTHLDREAAPVLRFRSRDHVRVWTSPCACGSTALRVRCIGRTDDMLIVRGVNVFPSAVREVVARFQPKVTGAILIKPRAKGVKQEPPLPVLVEGEAALAERIAKEIRSVLLFTPEVRMVRPQSLPRSDYKVKLVDYSEAT